MRTRWIVFFIGALLASPASADSGRADIVRDLVSRVGPVAGGALTCPEIARSRPLYGNVSASGVTSPAGELLAPRFANSVTMIVAAMAGHSNFVIEYKNALAEYGPDEQPNDATLEGYVPASVSIEALTRTGPQIDTGKLVDSLEAMNGLGTKLNFSGGMHQASHKIWGAARDEARIFQAIEL
jgi:branched-chain amino acid transport system substrate-binding protein